MADDEEARGLTTLQRRGDEMSIDQMFTDCMSETEVHCGCKKKKKK